VARLSRYDVPGHPQHAIQRGNNRCVTFVTDEDYVSRKWTLTAFPLFLLAILLVSIPALAEETQAYPDLWGRSLTELGLIPADCSKRAECGAGAGNEVYQTPTDIVFRVNATSLSGPVFLHFFAGTVTPAPPYGHEPPEYKKISSHGGTKLGMRSVAGMGRCARGSSLRGTLAFRDNEADRRLYLVLATRHRYSKPHDVLPDPYPDCGESPLPAGAVPFQTRSMIESYPPKVIALGDGTLLAWSWPLYDIIRFRLDGTTPYRPRGVAIIDGNEIDELEAKASFDPRKVHAALDALLKSRGY
jgi:hypothetical protein